MPYRNPIIPGFYPDPSICRVGEDYYLVTSSFEYFPGVPVFHSRDLVNWHQIGYCLTRAHQLSLEGCPPSRGIFAPTIRYNNGTFYMVTINATGGDSFIVTAQDPAGRWSDPIWIGTCGDPSLFFDDDGRAYLQSNPVVDSKEGIAQAEIDPDTGIFLTQFRHIWAGTGGRYAEAPHLYKIKDQYYLMIAEGGSEYGHMVTIARSASPWGPFISCPNNPILTHRNTSLNQEIQGTGHADLVQAHDGSWWMVFLAFRMAKPMLHNMGRETFLAPVTWEDGWPVVNGGREIALDMSAMTLPLKPFPAQPERDEFNGPELALVWNYLRDPVMENYNLTAKPGWLRLNGTECTLDRVASPTFIGRRQQHMCFRASALLEFEPVEEGDEAGITVLCDNAHHYDLATIKKDGKRKLVFKKTVGDIHVVVNEVPYEGSSLVLTVTGDRDKYIFSIFADNLQKTMGSGIIEFLTSEANGLSYTGVLVGLYSAGNGKRCKGPAYFDWFEYEQTFGK